VAAYQAASFFQKSAELNDPQQIQNDEDNGKNKQSVDPPACFWETWAYVRTQKAEQPQDDENYDDGVQHDISPCLSDLF